MMEYGTNKIDKLIDGIINLTILECSPNTIYNINVPKLDLFMLDEEKCYNSSDEKGKYYFYSTIQSGQISGQKVYELEEDNEYISYDNLEHQSGNFFSLDAYDGEIDKDFEKAIILKLNTQAYKYKGETVCSLWLEKICNSKIYYNGLILGVDCDSPTYYCIQLSAAENNILSNSGEVSLKGIYSYLELGNDEDVFHDIEIVLNEKESTYYVINEDYFSKRNI